VPFLTARENLLYVATPVTGISRKQAQTRADELLAREVKQRGKTGIMVTHDLRMVEYTDRVFEILDGALPTSSSPAHWPTDRSARKPPALRFVTRE
jgi:ABC-type lipoprotein export system ATPase subunit